MRETPCSRCGTPFGCARDEATCWCVELPALPRAALDAGADCLCPRCLAALIAAQVPGPADERAPASPDPDA